MNLIEAVKTGKPFRRISQSVWEKQTNKNAGIYLSIKDILADDWEIQEPEISISRSKFFIAYSEALKQKESAYPLLEKELGSLIAEKLGLLETDIEI